MLQLILGPAGSGKTTLLREQVVQAVGQGKQVLYLVPEQFSFEGEAQLHALLTGEESLQVEVLSFTRLCNRIFRSLGGLAGRYVDDTARCILMSVAVSEAQDQLEYYARQTKNTSFVRSLVDTVHELKTAGVTADALRAVSQQAQDENLRSKGQEIALLYDLYQALIDQSYSDSDDDLAKACQKVEEQGFFGPYEVYIDSFTAFMAGEYRMLRAILAQAQKVTIALTADQLSDEEGGLGVFSAPKGTARRFVRMARELGVPVLPPVVLTACHRFQAPELCHLEGQLFRREVPYEGPVQAVHLTQADNVYEEVAYVAAQIHRMVSQKGLRYREIALIGRKTEGYTAPLAELFPQYGIPYFLDRREDILSTPLVNGLLAALEAVRLGFETERILRLCKSGLLDLEEQQVAALENYCYIWSVQGKKWTVPFRDNPQGLAETMTEEDQAQLQALEQTRRQVVEPLERLRGALQEGTGSAFATALYEYLVQVDAPKALTQLAHGDKQTLEDFSQVWESVMGLLDTFDETVGPRHFPLGRLVELLRLGLLSLDLGHIPQTLDQVMVGDADRIRPDSPKVVFVLGANEGLFPLEEGVGGMFTRADREEMAQLGLELSGAGEGQAVLERFYVYFALTTPSQQLYVSFPTADLAGNALQPSCLVSSLKEMFPGLLQPASSLPAMDRIAGEEAAFQYLCHIYGQDSPLRASLMAHFAGGEKQGPLKRMEAFSTLDPFTLQDRGTARRLFGEEMRLSPSRLETYFKCPFAYFCASGLGLRARRRVELSPLETGSVIHYVLEMLVKTLGIQGLRDLSAQELQERIAALLEDYLKSRVADQEELPSQFRYLYQRLVRTLEQLVEQLVREFSQSLFEPVAFELPINREDGVPPIRLELPTGGSIYVEGIVDRVDVMEKDHIKYVRVVDYKSGIKTFRLSDVYYGLNMQMLLYLFSLWQDGQRRGTGEVLPAGVLYLPARAEAIPCPRDTSPQELEKLRVRGFHMSGLLLDDPDVLEGMERDVAGVFIPAKRKKNGELDRNSSVASLAELGRLKGHVERLITQMAQALRRGEIAPIPTQGLGYEPCTYCEFRAICRREDQDPVKTIAQWDRKMLFQELAREEEESHGQKLDPPAEIGH